MTIPEKAVALPRRASFLWRLIDTDSLGAMLVLAAIWLAALAGIRPLMLPDEGRYVGVAKEMLTSGNWLVPLLDGMPFFHKPPLFYWISALNLSVFGAHEWAARVASLLAGIITVGALYQFIRRYRNSQLATMSAVILLTQPYFYAGAQFANLDMLVAAMISLTILSGADAILRLDDNRPHRFALARTFVFAALGVLAKGLIGLVLPAGVLFFWLLWRRNWRYGWTLVWVPGWLLFALLSLPWFFWMQHLYPGFFDYFVIYQHFKRFVGGNFNNQQPIWFYLPVVVALALPWSLWLWRTISETYRKTDATVEKRDPLRSLMMIWFVLILVFFSLPRSKLVGYVLPLLPPLAYLIATPFSNWLEGDRRTASRWYIGTVIIAATICIALIVGVAVFGDASAKVLAVRGRPVFKANDQLAMVTRYQYDLPFYLGVSKPAWVVLDWSNPDIPKSDNWQKELFDASQFDRATGGSVLIDAAQFKQRLCQHPSGSVWVWGNAKAPDELPWLDAIPAFESDGKHTLWRLTPDVVRALPFCAERPTGG